MRPRAAAAAIAAALLIAGCGSSSAPPPYAGQTLGLRAGPAPEIALRTSLGRAVRLSQYRGRAVLLSFLYADCPDVCPLIAGKLRAALARLGPAASTVQLVAVSVDPRGDTPARVKAFLRAHDLTGRMPYLIGSRRELTRVWHAYAVGVLGTSGATVDHTAPIYGITAGGRQVVQYDSSVSVSDLVHDVPLLAGAR